MSASEGLVKSYLGFLSCRTQCHLAYFDHTTITIFPLIRKKLKSLIASETS